MWSSFLWDLCRKPEIDIQDEGDKPPRIEGHIQLQSVNFVYPARPESLVLRDFTMDVPAGTSFALCGSSGSGKSTVIQVIFLHFTRYFNGKTLLPISIKYLTYISKP